MYIKVLTILGIFLAFNMHAQKTCFEKCSDYKESGGEEVIPRKISKREARLQKEHDALKAKKIKECNDDTDCINSVDKNKGEELSKSNDKLQKEKECGAACRLYSPMSRAIGAGVFSAMSRFVFKAAEREIEKIEQNIKDLEETKLKITNSKGNGLGDCSENDFEDIKKPGCYCFNPDNSINKDRDPVGVCASLFPNYQKRQLNTARNEIRGCVTQSGRFVLKCQCRSKKTGANSCHKTTTLEFPGLGKGTRGLLASPFLAANKLNSGNIRGASAFAQGDARNIAKLRKKILEKKIGKKKTKQLDNIAALELKRISKSPYFNKLGQNLASRNAGGSLLSAVPSQVKDRLKKVAPTSLALADKAYSKSRGNSGKSRRGRNEEFKIGNSEEFAIDGVGGELADNKNYNYGDSDINKRPGTSIFKVISGRYHRSGYRRLFEETK